MEQEKEGKWDEEEGDKYIKLLLFSVDSQSDNLSAKDWIERTLIEAHLAHSESF
jgi:hypothetical protein